MGISPHARYGRKYKNRANSFSSRQQAAQKALDNAEAFLRKVPYDDIIPHFTPKTISRLKNAPKLTAKSLSFFFASNISEFHTLYKSPEMLCKLRKKSKFINVWSPIIATAIEHMHSIETPHPITLDDDTPFAKELDELKYAESLTRFPTLPLEANMIRAWIDWDKVFAGCKNSYIPAMANLDTISSHFISRSGKERLECAVDKLTYAIVDVLYREMQDAQKEMQDFFKTIPQPALSDDYKQKSSALPLGNMQTPEFTDEWIRNTIMSVSFSLFHAQIAAEIFDKFDISEIAYAWIAYGKICAKYNRPTPIFELLTQVMYLRASTNSTEFPDLYSKDGDRFEISTSKIISGKDEEEGGVSFPSMISAIIYHRAHTMVGNKISVPKCVVDMFRDAGLTDMEAGITAGYTQALEDSVDCVYALQDDLKTIKGVYEDLKKDQKTALEKARNEGFEEGRRAQNERLDLMEKKVSEARKNAARLEADFNAQLKRLETEKETLREELAATKADRDEWQSLVLIDDEEENEEKDGSDIPEYNSETLSLIGAKNRIVVVGGHPDWAIRMRSRFPNIVIYEGRTIPTEEELRSSSVIFVCAFHCRHTAFDVVQSVSSRNKIPLLYFPSRGIGPCTDFIVQKYREMKEIE